MIAATLLGAGVIAGALGVHPFLSYPASLAVLARFRPRPFHPAPMRPRRASPSASAPITRKP